MRRRITRVKFAATALFLTYLLLLGGCSQFDQETARQREADAQKKAHHAAVRLNQDARKLGSEVKQEARALNAEIGNAINSPAAGSNGGSEAEAKVKRGTQDLRVDA